MATAGTVFLDVMPNLRGFHTAMATQVRSPALKAGLGAFGLSAGATVGLAAAIGIKKSLDVASEFETAFAGVRKTVDATEAEFTDLSDGIREMSTRLPASTTEIAAVAEAAGQLGIKNEAILGFTKTMINLGETTNLSSDQAATALARLGNITKLPQKSFGRLGATIVDLGNNLATTEAEIVEMGLRIAGAGEQIGFTEAQTLGFAGALSSVGIRAEAGGSAISRVMIDMAQEVETGGDRLETFAKIAGKSTEGFAKAFRKDAAGAIASFVEGLGKSGKGGAIGALESLGITEVRTRDAMLRLSGAGDVLRTSLDIGSDAWKKNAALTDEARKRYETFDSKVGIFTNNLRDLGLEVGERVLPAMDALVVSLTKTIKGTHPYQKAIESVLDASRLHHEATNVSTALVAAFDKQLDLGIITLSEYRDKVGLQVKALQDQIAAGDDSAETLTTLRVIQQSSLSDIAAYSTYMQGTVDAFNAANMAAGGLVATMQNLNAVASVRSLNVPVYVPPRAPSGGGGRDSGGSRMPVAVREAQSTTRIELEMAGVTHEVTHHQKRHKVLLGGRGR